MKTWKKALLDLKNGEKTFESLLKILERYYGENVFSERIVNNTVEKQTYAQMTGNAKSVCSGLVRNTESPPPTGNFVGLLMENSPAFVSAFWGIIMSGRKPLLLSTRASAETIADVAATAKCNFIVADGALIPDTKGSVTYIDIASVISARHDPADISWADEIALHTSGTTGSPKIAVYNNEAVCAAVAIADEIIKKDRTIKNGRKEVVRLLAFLPFYHIFGLIANLLWFCFFGRTFIFLPSYDSAGIEFTCKRMSVSHFFAVPLVWESVTSAILEKVKKQHKEKIFWKAIGFSNALQSIFPAFGRFFARKMLFASVRKRALGSSLNYLISGGGAIGQKALSVLNGLGYSIHNGYGMTETGIVSVELSQRASVRNTKSVGKAFNPISCKYDGDGILFLKGPTICTAVIENGVRTERSGSAWFKTRDVFEISGSGRLTIMARCDDIIIGSDGENIYPEEIERHFDIHGLQTVCAAAINDEAAGDRIALFVRVDDKLTDGERQAATEQLHDASNALPLELKPSKILIVKDMPMTDTGKVKRVQLAKQFLDGTLDYAVAAGGSPTASDEAADSLFFSEILTTVKDCFTRALEISPDRVTDDCNFIFDLGGSSLQYYSLLSEISDATDTELHLSADNVYVTPRDFARAVTKLKSI